MVNTESFFQKYSSTIKVFIVGVVALLMMIPLVMIQELVRDRQQSYDLAAEEVGTMWSRPQIISGPVLEIPLSKVEKDGDGKNVIVRSVVSVNPDILTIRGKIVTETLHKSIYDVIVYQSDIDICGDFIFPEEAVADMDGGHLTVSMKLSDLRGIVEKVFLTFDGQKYEMESSERDGVIDVRINIDSKKITCGVPYAYSTNLKLKGSKSIGFAPMGSLTEVDLESEYDNPGFSGDFLPSERKVDDSGFSAHWKVLGMNRSVPEESVFGVELLVPVTQYQQTTRAVKYGILIILLIFLAAYLVEITTKKEIHLLQYLLIGFALALFYTLLLSMSEFISFGWSYLIASSMTVLLLGGYFFAILRSRHAAYITALLVILYAFIYLLLQMEAYSLLVGSLGLFTILGTIMHFSPKH